MKSSYIAVISDFVHQGMPSSSPPEVVARDRQPRGAFTAVDVVGGYLERLPLSLVATGLVETAEIWDFRNGPPNDYLPSTRLTPPLTRRTFRLEGEHPPFASSDMLRFIEAQGAPSILCVWGLGVDEAVLKACAGSFKIYNSIDAPALRVPPEVSRHFDLVLTGADWQSDEVRARHEGMPTMVLPIGPEFADAETFRPLGGPKDYDVIYVAAAQAYKRHDILFDALESLPRDLRTLCVFGYGEMREALEARARDAGIAVDFVGPPGVPFAEVNALMNRATIGVVCGVDDGAPAILTEYMLAGLPVLANEGLRCGLQYITPETGSTASAETFHLGMRDLIARAPWMRPRDVVLSRWTWPHSVRRLAAVLNRRFETVQKPSEPKGGTNI